MAADPAVVDSVLGQITQIRMAMTEGEQQVLDSLVLGRAADAATNAPEVAGHQLSEGAADANISPAIAGRVELVGEEYRNISP